MTAPKADTVPASIHPVTLLKRSATARGIAVALVCGAGVCYYGATVDSAYPVRDWLCWPLLTLLAWSALFHAACVSFGHLALTRWLGLRELPTLERFAASMAIGLVGFALGMYVLGAVALFRAPAIIGLLVLMTTLGAPSLLEWWRARPARVRFGSTPGKRLLTSAVIVAGILVLGLLFLQSMTPVALGYDARWYHLPVGEDYARAGRFVGFAGDYNKEFPQLLGLIATWIWTLPGLNTPLRCMLVLHNEFFMVLWTLAAIGAAVAWLLEREQVRGAWPALLLFPLLFVGEGSISGGDDHHVGFFGPLLVLAVGRAFKDLEPRYCALVAVLSAGAFLTKYQSVYFIVPAGLAITGRWLWLTLREKKSLAWKGPAVLLGVGLLLVAPHFLRNLAFHRNPFYPFAMNLFPSGPSHPADAAALWTERLNHDLFDNDPRLIGMSLGGRVVKALRAAFTFSFQPPYVVGSIFTLLLPVILFLRRPWRIVGTALGGLGAVMVWDFTYHYDRYAQTFTPVLAAVTAAVVIRAWELGWFARIGLSALLSLQVLWSADSLFQTGRGRLDDALTMITSGVDGRARTRFDGYLRTQLALDERLPKDAVVLFHNTRESLGLNRPVFQDIPGYQGLIDYRTVRTPRELIALWRRVGITHVAHERQVWRAFTKQEEVLFATVLGRYAVNTFHQGEYEIFELPAALPPAEPPYQVLSLGTEHFADGVYPVHTLTTIEPFPESSKHWPTPALPTTFEAASAPEIIDKVDVVLVPTTATLPAPLSAALEQSFNRVLAYNFWYARFSVWVRKQPRAPL